MQHIAIVLLIDRGGSENRSPPLPTQHISGGAGTQEWITQDAVCRWRNPGSPLEGSGGGVWSLISKMITGGDE